MNMTLIHYGLGGIIFLLVVTIILIVIFIKNKWCIGYIKNQLNTCEENLIIDCANSDKTSVKDYVSRIRDAPDSSA